MEYKSVSSVVNGRVTSPYSMQYMPKIDNKNVEKVTYEFLRFLVYSDINMTDSNKKGLLLNFSKLLAMCESPKDFSELSRFLTDLAKLGGIAVPFSESYTKVCTPAGKEIAIDMLKKQGLLIETTGKTTDNEQMDIFKNGLKKCVERLREFQVKKPTDLDDIYTLNKHFKRAESILEDLRKYMDYNTYNKYLDVIVESMKTLKQMGVQLEDFQREYNRIGRSM